MNDHVLDSTLVVLLQGLVTLIVYVGLLQPQAFIFVNYTRIIGSFVVRGRKKRSDYAYICGCGLRDEVIPPSMKSVDVGVKLACTISVVSQ